MTVAIRQSLAERLAAGVAALHLDVDAEKQARLLDYLELLVRWNAAYNLSGIKEPERMVGLHLLDSLSLLPLLPDGADTILDAGSGAGLPGIPLAISLPGRHFILLDSNGKKARFMRQAAACLNLGNVEVVNERVESFQSARQIDIVITRAFSSLRQCLDWTGHLLGDRGSLLAMKGHYPEDELADLPEGFALRNARAVAIPAEDCRRHVLEIGRT